ncbi:SAV_915 family protein [Streptomyces zaomyceticus]|uniref:SAV_915 family protein n=1 Tax=Streptomyces zaomyceticus TaxID=68286 RepID=UPI002E1BBCF3
MADALYGDDPEPGEQLPAGRLCVPVRPGTRDCAIRLFRTPVGARTAVAFTDPARLRAVLGADQPWIPLAEPALRALVEPLDVRELRIDPALTAPAPPTSVAATAPVPGSVPVSVLMAESQSRPEPRQQPRPLTTLAG